MNEATPPVDRLAISENMTIYNAEQQKQQLLEALAATQHLELELSGVSQMDTAGLQLLVLLKREAIQSGKVLSISGHSPEVQKILDFCNLVGVFGDPMHIPASETA